MKIVDTMRSLLSYFSPQGTGTAVILQLKNQTTFAYGSTSIYSANSYFLVTIWLLSIRNRIGHFHF